MTERQKFYTDAQRKAQKKWNAANLERLSLSFKAGHREQWERAAAAAGMTLSKWVLTTLDRAAADPVPADDPDDNQ